jgi:hypothetical protein
MAKTWKKVAVTGVTEATVTERQDNDEFETVLYNGDEVNNTQRNLTNITGSVDFVWTKARNQGTYSHEISCSLFADGNRLKSNVTDIEDNGGSVVSLGNNGYFETRNSGFNNNVGDSMVAWCASLPNHTVSNNDGSITSETKANSFMSVVSWVGNGINGSTVGHGLSQAPELVIEKGRESTYSWVVRGDVIGDGFKCFLDTTNAKISSNVNINATSSVFTVAELAYTNETNKKNIAYCFTSVAGKCKVGSYSSTGTVGFSIDVGFEPAWIMIKSTNNATDWVIVDS